ncbi:MAG: MFS transporter, partial [Thermomicrobium sp.]|nr:MFS transporter [Thermomicrobium sp.]
LARAIGPMSAAAVIAVAGPPIAFAVNSLSFVVFTVGLLLVRPAPQEQPERRPSFLTSLTLLREQPRLAVYLAVVVAVSVASDPVNAQSPALANAYGADPAWAGAIVGAFGAGAVSAGVLVGGRQPSASRIAVTLLVMAAGIAGLGSAPWLSIGLTLVFGAGFGYLASNAAATANLQLGVPESARGRMMALWSIAFLGTRPFASMLNGVVAEALGVRVAAIVMALPAAVLGVAVLTAGRLRIAARARSRAAVRL